MAAFTDLNATLSPDEHDRELRRADLSTSFQFGFFFHVPSAFFSPRKRESSSGPIWSHQRPWESVITCTSVVCVELVSHQNYSSEASHHAGDFTSFVFADWPAKYGLLPI